MVALGIVEGYAVIALLGAFVVWDEACNDRHGQFALITRQSRT